MNNNCAGEVCSNDRAWEEVTCPSCRAGYSIPKATNKAYYSNPAYCVCRRCTVDLRMLGASYIPGTQLNVFPNTGRAMQTTANASNGIPVQPQAPSKPPTIADDHSSIAARARSLGLRL